MGSERLTAEQVGELEELWAAWMRRDPGSYIDIRDELLRNAPSLLATAKREAEQAAEIERLRGALDEIMPRYCELYEAAGLGNSQESVAVAIARTALGKEPRP